MSIMAKLVLIFTATILQLHLRTILSSTEYDASTRPSLIPEKSNWCQTHSYNDINNPNENYFYLICKNVLLDAGMQLQTNEYTENLKYILFKDSKLTVLSPGIFGSFLNVTKLYLNNTNIEIIKQGVFNGLTQLEELYLQENNITVVSSGILNILQDLKILDISKNNIEKIEGGSLWGLINLKTLNLKYNNLHYLEADFLYSISTVEVLDLSHNFISNLESVTNSHVKMPHLKQLLINNNAFKSLPLVLLQNLSNLELLDASFNDITEIDFSLFKSPKNANYSNNQISIIKGWPNLKGTYILDLRKNRVGNLKTVNGDIHHLYLDWNELNNLEPFMFKESENFLELNLSYNSIKNIDVDSFSGLNQLLKLRLNSNKISILPIGCFISLESLEMLSLSYNFLTNLNYGTFNGLTNLTTLYLDHNKLSTLQENSFHVLSNLQKLYLNENTLTTISASIISNYLPNLNTINLNDNKWQCDHLLNAIKKFQNDSIIIIEGNSFQTSNVFGISCTSNSPFNIPHMQSSIGHNNYELYLMVIIVVLILLIIVITVGILTFLYFRKKNFQHNQVKEKFLKPTEIEREKSECGSTENVYCNIN